MDGHDEFNRKIKTLSLASDPLACKRSCEV